MKTHGMSKTRTYQVWADMIRRCHSEKNRDFFLYGYRGIEVSAEWRHDFSKFFSDMGESLPGLSIDRIDVNGDYNKKNCRWATAREQNENKRTNIFLALRGIKKPVSVWAREIGIAKGTLIARIRYGWNDKDVLTKKVRRWGR